MGKNKALEAFMEMNLSDSRVVSYNGIMWPYMINKFGTIWTTPFTEVRPFLDSKTGYLTLILTDRQNESCEVGLQTLMASIYLPNDNQSKHAKLKEGDPSQQCNYQLSNIEWCIGSEEDDQDSTLFSIQDEQTKAILVWCRRRQGYRESDIAREFDMSIVDIKDLIEKYDQKFITDFQFKDNPKLTRLKKFNTIRPFIAYLVNLGMKKSNIVSEIRLIVPEADDENAKRTIRTTCQSVMVKPEYRVK